MIPGSMTFVKPARDPEHFEHLGTVDPEAPKVTLDGCELSLLMTTSELTVHRAVRSGGASVLVVTCTAENPPSSAEARFRRTLELREDLDASFAARPLGIGRLGEKPALILEDQGADGLVTLLGRPLPPAEFFRLAVGLAVALRGFHARGLIHRDLKSVHVLVRRDTARAILIGTGLTIRANGLRQARAPIPSIVGTLAYMAPEQTGRMNRSVDSRADLYSAGVIFYEMLTGELPFSSSDPVELVHSQIARQPLPPLKRAPDVPEMASRVVMKLLSKSPEDRYQTAAGLEADLRRCQDALARHGSIAPFALGESDFVDRLVLPEKLYGRDGELEALLDAFERVITTGATELVVLAGRSGVGKSSLANELLRHLSLEHVIFATGKLDQHRREIPFAPLVEAFRGLVKSLLLETEESLAEWRRAILTAVGDGGQRLIALIPELEVALGAQPEVAPLPAPEAQHVFRALFKAFLGVFATEEHPLALFLDDLQWLDPSTLDLLAEWATDPEVRHVLLLGAYRDDEVSSECTFLRRLADDDGARVTTLVLGPLTREDVASLVSDALRSTPDHVAPLSALVFERTGGNPLFATQLLAALTDAGLLWFEGAQARWRWDLARIRAQRLSDDVVDLVLKKILLLPTPTREALRYMAALGKDTALPILALVSGVEEGRLSEALEPALAAGLIAHSNHTYHFLHDRIQDAAYALTEEAARPELHLRLGRLRLASLPASELPERIFELVNQLNRGAALLETEAERDELAALNRVAAERARATSAYGSALRYLEIAASLLDEGSWERCYDAMFALTLARCECEMITGEQLASERRLVDLWQRARSISHLSKVAMLRMALCAAMDSHERAVEVALEYLSAVGISWSAHPSDEEVAREFARMGELIGEREIASLLDLPPMSHVDALATMDVLIEMVGPAVFTDRNLPALSIGRTANLSLEHGNCDASALAYSHVGMVVGPRFGDYRAASSFGQLGYELMQSRGLARFEARLCLVNGHHILPWVDTLAASHALLRRSLRAALRTGDLVYTGYAYAHLITNALMSGRPLPGLHQELLEALDFTRKKRLPGLLTNFVAQLTLVRALRDLPPDFDRFGDEATFEAMIEADRRVAIRKLTYWTMKLQSRLHARDFAGAAAAERKLEALVSGAQAFPQRAEYDYYGAIARSVMFDSAPASERAEHYQSVVGHHEQLQRWAESSPATFEGRALLVGAERARIEGKDWEAQSLYERAILRARQQAVVHDEALALERAAEFYSARGFDTIALTYWRSSVACWRRYGADFKVRQLEAVLRPVPSSSSVTATTTFEAPVEHLDLATVIKISQAVSSELVLERLLHTLMTAALEHAGAERALLIVPRASHLMIVCEAQTRHAEVHVELRDTRAVFPEVPESVLKYVARTRESILLDDAATPGWLSNDPYLTERAVRSLLCLPIVNQAKLVGILLLENNLASHVFTPSRVTILRLLTAQAATSLENARLFAELGQEVAARASSERRLRRSQAYLSRAQALSATASFGWNPETGEAYWSEEAYRLTGVEPSVPPSLELLESRVHPDDRARVSEALRSAARHGAEVDLEHRFRLPDGTTRQVHFVARCVSDEVEGVRELIGAAMDITERKRAEAELLEMHAEMAHVARVATLGELAASIAHEVNQPLAGIVTNASACLRWLSRETPAVEEAQEAAKRVIRDGKRAGDVVSGLRSLFRKAGGPKQLLAIDGVLDDVVLLTRTEVQRAEVALKLALQPGTPLVSGDRVQLQQVVLNLILNAIDALRPVTARPRELSVATSVLPTGELCVSVTDNGVGFDPAKGEQLFQAFHSTKGTMGMGLSISKSIIEHHGGRIWAESRPEGGARFSFALPPAAPENPLLPG